MKEFIKGKRYKFKQPTNETVCFYYDIDSAYNQDGCEAYFPDKGVAEVEFLGLEEVGVEPYNKWRHEGRTVYINFCDDAFTEI